MSTQLINYSMSNNIVDNYQNAYLPHRSTETALSLIINDILIHLDNKAPFYLVLLYLSSDFDTFNTIFFPLDLMKLVYTVKSTVGLCLLFHLEHLQWRLTPPCLLLMLTYIVFHKLCYWAYIVHYLYAFYKINVSQIS